MRTVPWAFARDLFVGEYGLVTMGLSYGLAIVLPIVATFGIASGYLAVLVLAMYLTIGRTFSRLYSQPALIALTGVLLLYWISYVWLVANRGQMPEDPVLFALRDRRSRVLVLLMGICAWLAL
jgi:hypothetical protein